MKIEKLKTISIAIPSQWEAELEDGQKIDFHYRHGYLTIKRAGLEIYEKRLGRKFHSILSLDRLIQITRHLFDWGKIEEWFKD